VIAGDATPPRLAEALVRLTAGRDAWAEVTAGDLREEFAAVIAARGLGAARRWYYREAAIVVAVFARRALHRAIGIVRATIRPKGDSVLATLFQEVRLGIRALTHQPLVTGIVLLTLALGLGANAATFGMLDSLLLRPFPISGVDRLVLISENSIDDPFPQESVSPGNFPDLAAATALEGAAAFRWYDVNLAGADRPLRAQGFAVTSEFFRLLRVTPAHGRLFERRDTVYGQHQQVVLGDGLWRSRFGGNPAVVGSTIRLDDVPHTVVGIAPPKFDFPNGAELWVAYAMRPEEAVNRADHYVTVFGRLRDGVAREAAAAELDAIYARIQRDHPDATRGRRMVVRTFTEGMVDVGMPQILLLWQVAAALVLLIGCTNIVNLLLARGAARQRELAVRLAIGASRGRLVRQLLIESLVLALAAAPLALAVAAAGFALIRAAMPPELVRFVAGWTDMGVNSTVMAFTVAAAVVSAVVFGLLPALQASRPAVTTALRDGGRSVTAGASRSRLRRGLVVAEIALALPLLIASGLSAIGAQRFASGPQGYDPDGIFRLRTILAEVSYPDADSRRRFAERLTEAARSQPGVTMAAVTSILPASGSNSTRALAIEGRPPDPNRPLSIPFRAVSPEYMPLVRLPILEGRGILPSDLPDSQPVVVLSRAAADRHFPGESAVGKRVRLGGEDRPWSTVVGVSGDIIDDWFSRRHVPTAYVPFAQSPSLSIGVALRTNGDPATLAGAGRAAMAAVDPNQPAFDLMTMREALKIRTTGLRFVGGLMAVFGALALILAAIGIYSVMAFYVAQRRHEMGIRVALGATSTDVVRLTLAHGARMSALGIAIGAGLGVALARVLENVLFGVVALDPVLFASIAGALALVAFAASIIPARHAVNADPIQALRGE
jgi:putative ABC transport system permease protein